MRILERLLLAFSIYTRIPVPNMAWEEEDMRYGLCFLPVVGAVIGAAVYGGMRLCDALALSDFVKVCTTSLIPLLVTGGIHIDGFLDVMDAKNSYRPKEEKLAILKDPHIGAFAVIGFVKFALLWLGALAVIFDKGGKAAYLPLVFVFVLSRAGAAISAVALTKAKNTGMLWETTKMTGKQTLVSLFAELGISLFFLLRYEAVTAAAMTVVLAVCFAFYRIWTGREFGGVTGDTTGCFVCECELGLLFVIAFIWVIRSW